ncbi:VWA domain-containing protein [Streptomyces zaomyceticus]|uniref:VWA domain-containing protein n=1 Tax=Streptomyces zaomyceticus TaxID=68286 RepID=UPI0036C4B650
MGIRSMLRKVFGRDREETPATSVPPQTRETPSTSSTSGSDSAPENEAQRAADDLVAASFDNPQIPRARAKTRSAGTEAEAPAAEAAAEPSVPEARAAEAVAPAAEAVTEPEPAAGAEDAPAAAADTAADTEDATAAETETAQDADVAATAETDDTEAPAAEAETATAEAEAPAAEAETATAEAETAVTADAEAEVAEVPAAETETAVTADADPDLAEAPAAETETAVTADADAVEAPATDTEAAVAAADTAATATDADADTDVTEAPAAEAEAVVAAADVAVDAEPAEEPEAEVPAAEASVVEEPVTVEAVADGSEAEPSAAAEPEPEADADADAAPEAGELVTAAVEEPEAASVPAVEADPAPEEQDVEPVAVAAEPQTGEADGADAVGPALPLARVKTLAPHLVDAYKAAGAQLKKQELAGARAAVYLVVDRSGSMRGYFKDGSVQRLAEQVTALAAHLDEDATVTTVFFSTDIDGTVDLTPADLTPTRVEEVNAGLGRLGRTNYHRAVEEVLAHHEKADPARPALVVFQTDGAPESKTAAAQALAAAEGRPLHWRFVAWGEEDNKAFDFVRKLDGTPRTGTFFAGVTPVETAHAAFYRGLLAGLKF